MVLWPQGKVKLLINKNPVRPVIKTYQCTKYHVIKSCFTEVIVALVIFGDFNTSETIAAYGLNFVYFKQF